MTRLATVITFSFALMLFVVGTISIYLKRTNQDSTKIVFPTALEETGCGPEIEKKIPYFREKDLANQANELVFFQFNQKKIYRNQISLSNLPDHRMLKVVKIIEPHSKSQITVYQRDRNRMPNYFFIKVSNNKYIRLTALGKDSA